MPCGLRASEVFKKDLMLGLHPSDHRIGKRSVGNILYLGGQITQVNLKFIYSEKATKFCKISTLLLSFMVTVKSKVEILQNFVAFSEYMNFIIIPPSDGPIFFLIDWD